MTGCGGSDRPELPTSPSNPPPGPTPAGCPAGKRGLPSDSPILRAWPGGPAIRFGRESSTPRQTTGTSLSGEVFRHSSSPTGSSTAAPYFLHRNGPNSTGNRPVPVERGPPDTVAGVPAEHPGSSAPIAPRRPVTSTYHGRTRTDDYEWLRAKDDPAVIGYLEAENDYTQARTEHLADLRQQIFDEIKSRTLETDLSVPTRVRGYWYYGRSFEGRQYGASYRVPVVDPDRLGSPATRRGRATRRTGSAGRAAAARSGRAGRGPRLLLRRRLIGQSRRPAARLRDRCRRRRALHSPGQGPDHRRPARRRADRRPRRRHLGRRRPTTSTTRPSMTRGAPTRSGATGSAPPRATTSWSSTSRTAGSGSASVRTRSRRYVVVASSARNTSEYHVLDAADPTRSPVVLRRRGRRASSTPSSTR